MPYIISAKELIKQFQTMYREHWAYIWGKAEKGCVDCSGAFVYAFRQRRDRVVRRVRRELPGLRA